MEDIIPDIETCINEPEMPEKQEEDKVVTTSGPPSISFKGVGLTNF
jgi:hypothetical protein